MMSGDKQSEFSVSCANISLRANIVTGLGKLLKSDDELNDLKNFELTVDTKKSKYSTTKEFLSVTLNTIIFHRLSRFKVTSPKLKNMAIGLSPASLRIGGVRSALMIFHPKGKEPVKEVNIAQWEDLMGPGFWTNQEITDWGGTWNVTEQQWYDIMKFARDVGWKVTFNLNHFLWNTKGVWDPYNARLFLKLSQKNSFEFEYFQLTNEPNSHDARSKFGIWITPEQTANDFKAVRKFLDRGEFSRYKNVPLLGPDVTSLARKETARKYLNGFLEAGGAESIGAIGLHQYYFSGISATYKDFLNPVHFNQMQRLADEINTIKAKHDVDLPVYMTETTSAWGGGAKNLSNGFVSTFIFMDELGLCAKNGISRINRQDFHSGYYGLIDRKSLDPNPDYWLAVLFKRLIEGPVLSVAIEPQNDLFRAYAHCARTDYEGFRAGAIVVYYMNLGEAEVTFTITKYTKSTYKLYKLTKPEGDDKKAFMTSQIKLNNQLLQMSGDELPTLEGVKQKDGGPVVVVPYSLGFVVINGAKAKACL